MDSAQNKSGEKRDFTRIPVDTPAELFAPALGKHYRGICRDLSGGGMLVETRANLQKGCQLNVKLASHWDASPMLKARVKVARVTGTDEGRFLLGLEIEEILE